MHVDEVPNAGNADSVPVSGSPYDRRDIARIILRSPNAVVRDLKRRKTYPFAPWRAAVIEIETRMINQNREAASDQEHHEKEIEKMAVAHPDRKPVRPDEIIRINLRNRRNGRQASDRNFNPCG